MLRRTIDAAGPQPELLGSLGYIQGRLGDRDAALATLRLVESKAGHDHVRLAEVHAGMSDLEPALRHVEHVFENRGDILFVLAMPQFAELREDPRFGEMLARVGFAA
jgi:hypothetical protein